MKSLPNRGLQGQRLPGKMPHKKHWSKSTSQIVVAFACLIGTGMFLIGNAGKLKYKISTAFSTESTPFLQRDLNQIAADISVKILDRDFLGSGFIVRQQGDRYEIVTNQHVLRAGEEPYNIQTADGKIYKAKVIEQRMQDKREYDLAALEFTSDKDYTVATIGSSLYLEVGEPIFAVGFPYSQLDAELPTSDVAGVSGLAIKTGRIAIVLNKALVEGYQIGYTNDVKKGMSGGALLNTRGEVVGVNGKHAYPLWESPELYQDGSQPCPALEKLITRSSLAIPIEKTIELNPALKSLQPKSNVDLSRKSNLGTKDPQLVAKMQAEAEAVTQDCQDYNNYSIDK